MLSCFEVDSLRLWSGGVCPTKMDLELTGVCKFRTLERFKYSDTSGVTVMISRNTEKRSSARAVFRLLAVTTVALLSSVMVSVPASALTSDPQNPSFILGGPTPAMKLTTPGFISPSTVETVNLSVSSGNDRWTPINTCPSTGSPTADLASCGIVSVKSIVGGGTPVDHSSGVTVSKSLTSIDIVFTTPLAPVPDSPHQRVLEITISEGIFTSPPNVGGFEIKFDIRSAPNGGSYIGNSFAKSSGGYSAASFVGGTGSVGSMSSIIFPSTSNLPANTFTKSGFNFAGWSCTDGGQVGHSDQASLQSLGFGCETLYAVWSPIGSSAPAATADTTAPTITSGSTTPKVTTQATAVETYKANETVTWAIVGGTNSSLFALNTNTGALTVKNRPTPPGTYTVQIQATDSAGNKGAVTTVTITVSAALATTGTSLSTWAPALALVFGWLLVTYSRSLRASRARHLKI